MKEFVISEAKVETAVLVGLITQTQDERKTNEYLDELAFLAETAGAEVVKRFTQKLPTAHSVTYVGKGKLEEIRQYIRNEEEEEREVGMVIFDDELSAKQLRNIEAELKVKILDRTSLILDIFAMRAQTANAKTQVELAQYKYLLPRLTGMWGHLVRQTASGGKSPIGTRGPGETQLETDRRHIRKKIAKLEEDLEQVRRVRGVQRERRIKNEVPVVAIVGYTNAGKSTLLNALTGSDIPANNRLFDTLDTTTRNLEISDTCTVLVSDTVGFISKLPHHLVEAFKATLEELSFADLLLHVIDASNPEWREQAAVVDALIRELGAEQTPRIEVFNKSDLYRGDIMPHGEDIVSVSARTGEGLDRLISMIGDRLDGGAHRVTLRLPYDQGGVVDMLYREAKVERVEYGETIEVTAVCTPKILGRVSAFLWNG